MKAGFVQDRDQPHGAGGENGEKGQDQPALGWKRLHRGKRRRQQIRDLLLDFRAKLRVRL